MEMVNRRLEFEQSATTATTAATPTDPLCLSAPRQCSTSAEAQEVQENGVVLW